MERPRYRLNVIIDDSVSRVEAHARRLIREQREREFNHLDAVAPIGIANHSVLFPVICDDCGETFWAHDLYATHQGCKKKSSGIGFN